MRVLEDLVKGLTSYMRGVLWLKRNPRYLALLTVPWVGGIVALVGSMALFVTYQPEIFSALLMTKPEGWMGLALYWSYQALLYVALIVVAIVAALLMVTVIASPIYEVISVAVERDITGKEPPAQNWKTIFRVMLAEIKKAVFILLISLGLLFLPGMNVLSFFGAAIMVGWGFYDYVPARYGMSFSERLGLLRQDFWKVLGLGLWLVIPFVQIVLMPLAIVGGTVLGVERLQKRELEAG